MPVGFNSPARNLFLLGSTGAQVVTNFFKRIDQSAGTDVVYRPDEIRYNVQDQKFILAGSNETASSKGKGWFEKRTSSGSLDWNVEIQSTQGGVNTTLRALELDNNNNLIVAGKTGTVPWIAKYTNGGVITWQVTSNTSGVEYTGIAVDASNNIYACGSSSGQAYIERVTSGGSYSWGKYSSTTAGAITFAKCAVNSRGEVVAVGKIEDTIKDKGYIAKVNTSTGDLLWDRTIEDQRFGVSSSYLQVECTDVCIDGNDQIYVVGNSYDAVGDLSKGFIIKYTAEGNIIWQKETEPQFQAGGIRFVNVKTDTETEQTVVLGTYFVSGLTYGILSKYSRDGSLVWRRELLTNNYATMNNVNLDADPSFYYLLFADEYISPSSGTPKSYLFGKVSTSGNGLGNFSYPDGVTIYNVNYNVSSITDNIGRLSDGSVRQDTSDLITYPFNANKILFDDLATQVANKKVQVNEAGSYSDPTYAITTGYPKISKDAIVYGSNLLMNYDFSNKATYSGAGTSIQNLSSTSYTGTVVGGTTFNSVGHFVFDGNGDYISIPSSNTLDFYFLDTNGFPNWTMEAWIYRNSTWNVNWWQDAILACDDGPGANGKWIFSYNGSLMFHSNTSTSNSRTDTAPRSWTPNNNQWYHVVVAGNLGGVDFYQNLEYLGSSRNGTFTNAVKTAPMTIGYGEGGSTSFDGRIAQVRVYDRKLTGSEVRKNYLATRSNYGNPVVPTLPWLNTDMMGYMQTSSTSPASQGSDTTFGTGSFLYFPSTYTMTITWTQTAYQGGTSLIRLYVDGVLKFSNGSSNGSYTNTFNGGETLTIQTTVTATDVNPTDGNPGTNIMQVFANGVRIYRHQHNHTDNTP